jgi:hypothetical protein
MVRGTIASPAWKVPRGTGTVARKRKSSCSGAVAEITAPSQRGSTTPPPSMPPPLQALAPRQAQMAAERTPTRHVPLK